MSEQDTGRPPDRDNRPGPRGRPPFIDRFPFLSGLVGAFQRLPMPSQLLSGEVEREAKEAQAEELEEDKLHAHGIPEADLTEEEQHRAMEEYRRKLE